MKKGISVLYKVVMLLAAFSICSLSLAQGFDEGPLSLRNGGPEVAPPTMTFNGFSVLAGVQAIGLKLINPWLDQSNAILGGPPYGERVKMTNVDGTVWGAAARFGLEWGHVFTFNDPYAGLYLGLNVNLLTGKSFNQRNILVGQNTVPTPLQGVSVFFQTEVTMNSVINGLLKLGYAWGRYLVYFQAGAADANVIFHEHQQIVVDASDYKWNQGYAGGVGFEAMLTQKLILGVDYLYTYYRDMVIAALAPTLPAAANVSGWYHTQFQTHRVGLYLEYKFTT